MKSDQHPNQRIWIWPSFSVRHKNSIEFKTSGHGVDIRWSGGLTITENEAGFDFWHWLWANRKVLPGLLDYSTCKAAASQWPRYDWPSKISAPEDGLYFLSDSLPSASKAAEKLRTTLTQEGYETHIRPAIEFEGPDAPLWRVLRVLTGSLFFIYANAECSLDTELSEDPEVQEFAARRILDDLQYLYPEAKSSTSTI